MNPRQLGAPLALLVFALLFGAASKRVLPDYTSELFLTFGLLAAAAVVYTASQQKPGSGVSLGGVLDALRTAARGKRPQAPEDASGELAEVYDEIGRLVKRSQELTEEVAKLEASGGGVDVDFGPIIDAAQRAAEGERIRPPSGASAEVATLYAEMARLGERIALAEGAVKGKRGEVSRRRRCSTASCRASTTRSRSCSTPAARPRATSRT